jgi:hypothetical protein
VLVPAEMSELAREARTIARGRIVAAEARWLQGRRGIETVITLEAESYLKGPLGPIVQFRVPGGQLGAYRQIVIGAPVFAEGQRVVVFLGAQGPRLPWLLGLSQGVYRVSQSAGAWMVHASPAPGATARAGARGVTAGAAIRREPIALAAFEEQVRRIASAPPAAGRPRAVPR